MHAKSPLKHYTTLMVRWGYYHFGCCRRKVPETRVFLLYANIIKKDSLLQTPARKVPTAVPSESSLYRQLLCPLSFTPHQHPQDGRSCLGFFSFYQRGCLFIFRFSHKTQQVTVIVVIIIWPVFLSREI